ncbi:MAG: aldo/keto reductase [Oscillospiraceae bacterium]|nr:aldo/keto reductase [Oscillospiraceae bacterium]
MTYNLLGKTGLSVSPLCFGTLPFSPLQNYRGGGAAGEALARAFALGVNFIDTAQLYGNYDVLRPSLKQEKRDIVVASKTYAYTREDALLAVEEARAALERDVIEIFLLHEQESEHTLRGHAPALEALYECKAKGTVRAVGLSTHRPEGVFAAVNAGLDVVHPLLNMAGLGLTAAAGDGRSTGERSSSLQGRAAMEAAVTAAAEAGLGVYIMKALGGGHLWRDAQNALTYARQWGHSLALGMRDAQEVEAAAAFFETGALPALKDVKPRTLHIAPWCTGCGRCVDRCPNHALTVSGGHASCDQSACLTCGYCGAVCPEFCIKVV